MHITINAKISCHKNAAVYFTLECYMHGSSSFAESTVVH